MVVGLILLGCRFAQPKYLEVSAADRDEKAIHDAASTSKTRFLIVGKGKIADPLEQQQRCVVAVRKVAEAAKATQCEAIVDALAEEVMSIEQYRRGQAKEAVTGAIFRERLRQLAETATSQDTVVIYTHSHGRINGFEKSQPLGGIVMDLPIRQPERGGTFLWDEYTDLLLKIPAKNVIVLTMSCFSGGLIAYLSSPSVSDRWKYRQQREGRNLIVLTSQNKELSSNPILKDNEIVNPFTYAVAMAFKGEADGFTMADGKPVPDRRRDGKLTVGEMVDFILYTTENTISENSQRKNTAKPQQIGSFDRGEVLFERVEVPDFDAPHDNSAQ